MKTAGETARNPLKESFSTLANNKMVLVALFGIAAGLPVIWYTAQFQSLYFLQNALREAEMSATLLIGIRAVFSLFWFILFAWLSDTAGRCKPVPTGYAMTRLFILPLFPLNAN